MWVVLGGDCWQEAEEKELQRLVALKRPTKTKNGFDLEKGIEFSLVL